MKAVITHISGNRAVLLKQDGTFTRAKNHGYRIGQQISLQRTRKPVLRPLLALASLVLVLLSATAFAAQTLPFSYVSVDVNPSLQMTLNWFNRVLTVEAANEDTKDIVLRLMARGIVRQPVESAIQMIYSVLEEDAYFTSDSDNDVVMAVASYGIKNVDPLLRQLAQMQTIENNGIVLNVRTMSADQAMIAEAKEFGTTAGKLSMVKPLANGSAEETKAWLRKSVREILAASQGDADTEELLPLDDTEQPAESKVPLQSPAPGNPEPSLYPGGGSTSSPQQSPVAETQDSGQKETAVPPGNTPKPTVANPTSVPKPTASGSGTEGGNGQAQPAEPSPGGGQGKGN